MSKAKAHRKTDSEVKAEIKKLMNGEPIGKLQCLVDSRQKEHQTVPLAAK